MLGERGWNPRARRRGGADGAPPHTGRIEGPPRWASLEISHPLRRSFPMRSRGNRLARKVFVEHLEGRSLLSGGLNLPPGSLDPGFGSGGIATSSANFGPTADTAAGVALQRQGDGKVVVAGTARGVDTPS